jgi:hypothetical protein
MTSDIEAVRVELSATSHAAESALAGLEEAVGVLAGVDGEALADGAEAAGVSWLRPLHATAALNVIATAVDRNELVIISSGLCAGTIIHCPRRVT